MVVLGWQLEWMILKISSNLHDSMIPYLQTSVRSQVYLDMLTFCFPEK